MEPNTVFESITGVPAPRDEAVVAEPMNMESAGAACDFYPNGPIVGNESPPVMWAFPAGQVESAELIPGSKAGGLPRRLRWTAWLAEVSPPSSPGLTRVCAEEAGETVWRPPLRPSS
ncbi:hypothetical protein [Streptomyces griseus]|uniref:hypothetical protein n=1 Tax=Streptomyces griseus TaxID=1911 RepID=UPI00083FEA98|nr:hypothetical protein [Streptomyces griseus]